MMESLKTYLRNREAEPIIRLITQHPEILEAKDENGSSGFLVIAYSGLEEAFTHAKQRKKSYTFPEAVVGGDLAQVNAYLVQDENIVNRYSDDGFTPLALASFFNQTEIAYLLLTRGADPDLQANNPARVNALHAAVAKENTALCKCFLEHGANVNAAQAQNVTPLHAATHRGNLPLVRLLVEHGADVTFRMDNGDTAIRIAERDGHREIENYLKTAVTASPSPTQDESA